MFNKYILASCALLLVSYNSSEKAVAEITVSSVIRGGAQNAPQTLEGVLKDCETRIKLVKGKENLFVVPKKPTIPWKKSDWEKKKNAIEAAKKEYLENIQNLNAFFAT